MIAELVRLLFDTWPESHPRTVVLVPGKELAEQNADKLMRILPSHIRVGLLQRQPWPQATGCGRDCRHHWQHRKNAHLLGNIRCVVIDEAHLVNPDGAGQYRQFLNDLARYCVFRVVGFTATPFRGNGVWLTDGDEPLFTGIAHETPVSELLQAGYLSPLIRPIDAIQSRIDTSGISTSNGDYNIGQLSDRVSDYLPAAADEACTLAADRHKWIAFCQRLPTPRRLPPCSTIAEFKRWLSAGTRRRKSASNASHRFAAATCAALSPCWRWQPVSTCRTWTASSGCGQRKARCCTSRARWPWAADCRGQAELPMDRFQRHHRNGSARWTAFAAESAVARKLGCRRAVRGVRRMRQSGSPCQFA